MKLSNIKNIEVLGWASQNTEECDKVDVNTTSTKALMSMTIDQCFDRENCEHPKSLDYDHVEDFWAILVDVSEDAAMEFYNANKI